jgi:hypothetical protein
VSTDSAIAAVIHDQLGQVLTTVFKPGGKSPFEIRVNPDDGLLKQLQQPGDAAPRVSLGFALDIVTAAVSVLLDALPAPGPLGVLPRLDGLQLLDKLRGALQSPLGLLERQRDLFASLIAARNPRALGEALSGLFQRIQADVTSPDSRNSVIRLQAFIGKDVGTALPFATMMDALKQAAQDLAPIPGSIERALLDYFFKGDGYQTLDGESVVSPVQLADLGKAVAGAVEAWSAAAGVQSFKGLFSKTNAERYLRDTIRVIVESAYDAGRGLADRGGTPGVYGVVTARLQNLPKFVSWFRGFSSMAESVAMRAVEVGTQGVSEFQTNPLIAAAAGTFAGTVARKLAQDSFLALLREELHV